MTITTASASGIRRTLIAVLLTGMVACGGEAGQTGAVGEQMADTPAPVRFSPLPLYADNTLTAIVSPTASERGPVAYEFLWFKNGDVIEGATGRTLASTHFKKGDVLTVTVTPKGAPEGAAVSLSAEPITVQNSAPVVTSILVAPLPLSKQGTLRTVVKSYDVDGDPIEYSYQWFKNQKEIEGQREATLDSAFIAKGDVIELEVIPTDGMQRGEHRLSIPVAVRNAPPQVTSQPPTSMAAEANTYLYPVTAVDPDGDPVTFSLTSAPSGMSIDPSSGLIRWQAAASDAGLHPIEVTVTDAEGAKSMQQFDLSITPLATPVPAS